MICMATGETSCAVSAAYLSSTSSALRKKAASCFGSVNAAPIVKMSRIAKIATVALGMGPVAVAAPNMRANMTSFVMPADMLTAVVPTSFAAPCTLLEFSSSGSSDRSHALSMRLAAV